MLLGVVAFAALAPPATAAATYTFYASGSAVGETSPGVPRDYQLNLTNLNSTSAISFNLSVVALPQGWSGQLSQSAVTVSPSGTLQVTLSVTPPSTALADAVGKFVNVTATPDDNTSAQTVATTTRVTETFGVSLTVIAQAGTSGNPGANVSWLAYLKNTGNSQQTYTVTVDNTSYTNTNLTTNLVTVQPAATEVIQVWINISQTAPVGTLPSYIRAVSTANSSSQDTVTFAASVNARRAVSLRGLTTDDLIVQTEPEASVVFSNILVANDGNVADSYVLLGTANASRHGSWVSFTNANISLSAFSQQYLSVTVTVPASASATGDYTVEFRIVSTNSTAVIAFLNLTVTVTPKHDLAIGYDALVAKLSGDPGTVVAFPV
ncbi:MAG TPA: NEW3 domain-containing protein, partial [Candidatus Thermoplasmatota archaeon]